MGLGGQGERGARGWGGGWGARAGDAGGVFYICGLGEAAFQGPGLGVARIRQQDHAGTSPPRGQGHVARAKVPGSMPWAQGLWALEHHNQLCLRISCTGMPSKPPLELYEAQSGQSPILAKLLARLA